MSEELPAEAGDRRPIDLEHKVDIIAGAVADLEGRMSMMAGELASMGPKLNELLDRHPAGLGAAADTTKAVAADVASSALEPVHTGIASIEASVSTLRDDLIRALEALGSLTGAVADLDAKSDDRLAAVRDAATAPVADLQVLLSARSERLDGRIAQLAAAVEGLQQRDAEDGQAGLLDAVEELAAGLRTLNAKVAYSDVRPVAERVEELAGAVQSMSWQLPEISEQIASLWAPTDGPDEGGDLDEPATHPADGNDPGPAGSPHPDIVRSDEHLIGEITARVELAMAGLLRLIDERLAAARLSAAAPAPAQTQNMGGFEAGAVMGAAQAAWSRLEQRLDQEFDDLGRQLQAMSALVEQATASAEAAANRPVVTGDQLRQAASTVKDSVLRAGRARRDRRGGPRGLNPGR